MILRFTLSFILSCFSIVCVFSQGIHGRITNAQGEAIPFATIYIPDLSTGTTSNSDGKYELKLPEGQRKVLFQCLGFQTQTIEPIIGESLQEINIRLATQDYQIPEIKVLASGEDPAYYIMRRAIALAPYYQKQVSKYSCKVYLKGSSVVEKIPGMARMMMDKKEEKEMLEPYVVETVSKIDFELPDKVSERVLAMRSSGKSNNTSPMPMITNNLYDADKYGIVSPVGKNSLKTYRFHLDGVFTDQGRTINKIKVDPRTKSGDVFTGYIYIVDGFWNIYSADFNLNVTVADVNMRQVYGEVNKNTWMPVSLSFDMDISGMGFKAKMKYVASISEYQTTLNPSLDHSFLEGIKKQQLLEQQVLEDIKAEEKKTQTAEKSKAQERIDVLMQKPKLNNRETVKLNRMIEAEAERNSPPEPLEIKSNFQVSQKQVNNDSVFWKTLRPIPLTESEKNSFAEKDSFLQISAKPEYQDSMRNSKRKFKIKHLLVGKTYDYSVDSIRKYERFTIPNLTAPTSFSFNSVDGLRAELPFSYFRSDSTGHMLRLEPHLAYAFARQKLDASFSFSQRMNGMTNSWISAIAGTTTADFNRTSGMLPMNNDLYTLWLEENYKRYYRRDFLQVMINRELNNGLNLNIVADYSDNSALSNHSNYSFIDYKNKVIQPNVPINNTLEAWQLENHQTFAYRIVLEYTPNRRYRVRNHVKMYAESKFPTYSLTYKSALSDIFGSEARYDLVRLGIRQKINFGIDDHFSYSAEAGKFLNRDRVYFEDFQHFNTQPTPFMFSSHEDSFRLLPFYQYSTSNQFLEANANWQTRRLILKRLPIIKNSSIKERLFVNYLSTPELKNYVETGYGISNLFLLLNVEAVAGFENGKFRSAGVKVSLNLK